MPTTDFRIGRNLPKVTEYVKNLGKSVAYSTVDALKDTMEDTSEFIETNQELFKDIYSAAKNYQQTMKAVDKSIRSSKVYEAGQELKKTLFDSIRTGKFYDAKREAEYAMKAGGDMADFSDMDDWGSSNEFDIDMNDENFDASDAGRSASIVTGAVHDATEAQAGIIAKSSEYLAETTKASTKLLFGQGERLYATVNSGLAGTQSMLARVNSFLEGPLTTHLENSTKFYQETTTKMNEIAAMMKESLEMQRNLYKKEQQSYDGSQFSKVGANPDLREYGKQVYKNFMEFLGPEAQMLLGNDMGENANMLLTMVANPLKFIPDFLVSKIIPATIKKSLESLDKSFTGIFANIIARFNKWASDESDAPEFIKAIGKIFGLKTDNKNSIDTSKYEKGPVPFDGVTRKAITEVIPGYLARIEGALTSRTERVFDYQSGKWMSIQDVEKRFKNRKERRYADGAWDISDDVMDFLRNMEKESGKIAADKYRDAYQTIVKKIYEDYGAFAPYRAHGVGDDKQDPWEYYGVDKDTFMTLAKLMIGSSQKDSNGKDSRKMNAMKLAASMLDSRESWGRYLRDAESGDNVVRLLASGAFNFDMSSDSITKNTSGKQVNGTGIRNIIADATDKYNKNIFYYLRGIYAELIAFRNVGYGGRGYATSGDKRYTRGFTTRGAASDPLADLERIFGTEIDAEAAKVVAQQAQNQKQTDFISEEQFTSGWEAAEAARRREREEENKKHGWIYNATHNEDGSDKGFLESLLNAGSLGAKFKVIAANINKLTEKPGLAIAGVIDTADRRLFQLVFGGKEGQEITDSEGRTIKGFLDYLVMRTQETFDKMNDWLDENILEPLKKKLGVDSFGEFFKQLADKWGLTDKWDRFKGFVGQYTRPVIDRMKEKMGWGWDQFKGSMGRTYGAAIRRGISMIPAAQATTPRPNPSDFMGMGPVDNGGVDIDALLEYYGVDGAARGGIFTRRGLAVVSPGERIVPVGGKGTQKMNLAAERAFAKRYGIRNVNFLAGGTDANQPIPEADQDKVMQTVRTVTSEVMADTDHKGIANVIASGLIGGGVSLLTGLVGGPLLGAAVGSAFGITQNSKTVQNWLFGEEVVDQTTGETSRKGGVISKEFQEKFKKYFPGMRDFGLAGAVAGLFTPFGLIGGLLGGSAIGFIKQTDAFQDLVFGEKDENGERDGGLLKKEFRDRVKKAAPRMAVGAIGAALFGPFGILGNAILGAGLGFATTTDRFHDFVFGKKDGEGKRKGGLVGAVLNWTTKNVLMPLKNFAEPVLQMGKNIVTQITDFFKDTLANMAENSIGRPLKDFLEYTVFRNVFKWTKRLFAIPFALGKGLISAPFKMAGFVGNNIRMGQIRRGTALDMTAEQRNKFRSDHVIRWGLIGRQDIFSKTDRILESMQGQEGVDQMKVMKAQVDEYLDTRRTIGNKAAEKVKEAGIVLSDYLTETNYRDDPDKNLYDVNKSGAVVKIHKAIADGDLNKVTDLVFKLNIAPDQAQELIQKLAPYVQQIAEYRSQQKDVRGRQQHLQAELSRATGGALRNFKNIRKFSRMLNNELDYREAQLAEQNAANNTPEVQASDRINESINKRADDIINAFKEANGYLRKLSGEDKNSSPILDANGNPIGGGTRAVDDILIGSKKDLANKVNKGLHVVEKDGVQGLADSKGNIQNTASAGVLKQKLKEEETSRKEEKNFREKLHDSFFGKAAGGLLRGAAGALSFGKEGLLGKFFGFFEEHYKLASAIKWFILGTTAVAAVGHGSDWFTEKVMPFLKNQVGPWLIGTKNDEGVLVGGLRGVLFGNKNTETGEYEGGLFSGLTKPLINFFETSPIFAFFRGIGEQYQNGGIVGVIDWIVTPVIDWYKSGIGLFIENIAIPTLEAIVYRLPEILVRVFGAAGKGILKFFGIDSENVGNDTGYKPRTDENGNVTGASGYRGSNITDLQQNTEQGRGLAGGLGVAKGASVGFYTDNNQNKVWADKNGVPVERVVNQDGTASYYYEDGTQANRNDVSLVKTNEYTKTENKNTGIGAWLSGVGNSLLSGLAGYKIPTGNIPVVSKLLNATPTFSGRSIGKSVTNIATKGPIGKIFSAIGAAGKTLWNTAVGSGTAARNLGTAIKENGGNALSKIVSGIKESWDNMSANIAAKKAAAGAADDVAKDATSKIASAVAGATDEAASGILAGIKKNIIKFFNGLAENSIVKNALKGVAKIFNTSIDDVIITKAFQETGEMFAKKAGDSVAKSALKSLGNALSAIPIVTIVLAAGYFIGGFNDAHTIFGIVRDIEIPGMYRVVAGLVNAVKNALPGIGIILAFIDTSTIIDIFTKTILPAFRWDDTSLKKMQEESQRILDEANAEANPGEEYESVGEYNRKEHGNIIDAIGGTMNAIGNTAGKAISTVGGAIGKGFNAVKNFFTGGGNKESGQSRRSHLYQHSAALAGKRFGNGTIGNDGCAPIAAMNLINRLNGHSRGLDGAIDMATGYQDATGGTNLDYFNDILAANGYGSIQTGNKQALLSSIARGNPAVLLGNSGKEHGTPFGANNHYINAMGFDKTGRNIWVEDPDLPQSMVKYPAKDVLNDTISGVMTTGRVRSRGIGFGRAGFNIRKRKRRDLIPSGHGTNMVTVSKIAERAAPILFTGESGGNFNAVNANDNGAVSIGLIQWHGARAHDILYAICNELGEEESIRILGNSLYRKIIDNTRNYWNTVYFSSNSSEVQALKTFLNTDASKKVQNAKILLDLNSYINTIKSKGIKDENAIIFFCHIINAWGYIPKRFLDGATKKAGGSAADITLDDIYNTCMEDAYYKSHYGDNGYGLRIYNSIANSEPVGDGTTTIDAGSATLINSVASTAATVNQLSTENSTSSDPSIASILLDFGKDVLRAIFGDSIINLLSGGGNSSSGSSGVYGTGTYNGEILQVSASASVAAKQQALVAAMNSIKGKIPYSLSGPQDPDKGSASCASTVGWAYRKVLGLTGMSASSQIQSTDTRFQDVIRLGNPGSQPGKTFDTSVLQPGDIVYMYNKWNGGGSNHTEMYAGNGMDLSHGGPGAGPQDRTLDAARQKKVWAVRRLTDFVEQSKRENTVNSAIDATSEAASSVQDALSEFTSSGSSRKRKKIDRRNIGKARINDSTINKANNTMRKYGLNTNLTSSTTNYATTDGAVYAEYFATMVTLLSVIAGNTEALQNLQQSLATRGVNVDTETLQKAAGNARKRTGHGRQPNPTRMNGGFVDTGDSTNMYDILNSPTGNILQVMEALASE